jgi:tetratricopeptide (TPR) repeat protein
MLAAVSLLLVQAASPIRPGVNCAEEIADERQRAARDLFLEAQPALVTGEWERAFTLLLRSIEQNPLDPLAQYGVGEASMGRRRYADAVAAFTASRDAFTCAASRSAEERKQAEARVRAEIRELREAIRVRVDKMANENAVLNRQINGDTSTAGDRLRARESLRAHIDALEASLHAGAAVPVGVTLALGTAHFQAGSLDDAEREFRAVLEVDPSSGDAHNNLAVICMLTNRLDEAEREVKLAEKAGVRVNPRLKEEIRKRRQQRPQGDPTRTGDS